MACLVSLLPGKIPKGEKASMKNEYCYDEKRIFLVILALISGVTPCSAVDDVRKVGTPVADAPFDTQSNEEKGLESVTSLVQDESFKLDLASDIQPAGKLFSAIFKCRISGLRRKTNIRTSINAID